MENVKNVKITVLFFTMMMGNYCAKIACLKKNAKKIFIMRDMAIFNQMIRHRRCVGDEEDF